MVNKKRKRLKATCVLGFILVTGLTLSIYASYNCLTVREYTYSTEKVSQELTLVVLSDLHGHEFGEANKNLARKVAEQKPDIILLDGDFLNEDSKDESVATELIRILHEIAPVYYALGNHEITYMENGHSDLLQKIDEAGAAWLELKYVDAEVKGQPLRIGGMYDYAFGLDGEDSAEAVDSEVGSFLKEYQNTDCLKIMMSHRPDSFIFGNASSVWKVDLVVSGHDHGGQVVLPVLGGVFGGDQGYFPEYIHGMYQKDQMHIFVTSGLGSYGEILSRINNVPEIAVIHIKPFGGYVGS